MLNMALDEARKIGLTKVLITFNDSNKGSARVIEKNGGILENKIDNVIDGEKILSRRYWIKL